VFSTNLSLAKTLSLTKIENCSKKSAWKNILTADCITPTETISQLHPAALFPAAFF
jgi:hypothetical protein